MRQQIHYIIEISSKIRHNNFFVTTTRNLNCPEIKRALLSRQPPQDRLHLAVRVFMTELQFMMSYVKDEKFLSNGATYAGVIEFQKGPLSGANSIFFLDVGQNCKYTVQNM